VTAGRGGETLLPPWQHRSDVRVDWSTELVLIYNDNVTGLMGRHCVGVGAAGTCVFYSCD
jgi:hypothetical protein